MLGLSVGEVCADVAMSLCCVGLSVGEVCADVAMSVYCVGLSVGEVCADDSDCGDHAQCMVGETGTAVCACAATYILRDDGHCGEYMWVLW